MRVDRSVPSLALLFLLCATAGYGQSLQVGTISGVVADSSGAVVPGVTVTLTSPVLQTPRTMVTDGAGGYAFQSLPLGDYSASYELDGFKKVVREGLAVTAARTLTVDVTLQTGDLSETVNVVGGQPTVDVTNTNVATSIDAQALQMIPTARDVWAILQNLAPQVVLDREDVGGSQGGLQAVFSAFGSTWHQNTYALNGVNVTDPAASGAAGFYYDFDSFQETQVSTAQHSAEIGTPGVYYNIIVKSGTNTFHGGSAYYFENDSMVSDNLSQELKDQGVSIGSSINLFSDWTAQLGGPLLKDRLRFFTSWRDWRIHRDVVDFPESENTDMFSGLGNVTYQLNQRNRLTGLYTRQTYYKPNRNASALNPPETTWIEDDVFTIYQGAYNSQIGNNAVFDARVSYSTITFPLNLQPDVTGPNVVELSTGVNSGAASQNFDQWRTRLAIDGAVSIVKRTGRFDHNIKAGYQYLQGPLRLHSGRLPGHQSAGFQRRATTCHRIQLACRRRGDLPRLGAPRSRQRGVRSCDAQPRPAVRALRRSAARTGCSGRSVLEPAVVPRRGRLFLEYARSADWSGLRSAPVAQGRGQSRVCTLLPRREHRLCLTSQPEQSRWDGIRMGRPERRPRVPTRRGGHAAFQLWWLDHQRRFRSEAAVHRRVHGGRGV